MNRYPGLTMAEAIDKAAKDGAELLAPNSVNSYLSAFIAMMNYAVNELEWAEKNPAAGLA